MRCGWLVLATVVVSCGDNQLPVGLDFKGGSDLTIVAHPEDSLVFMQPDLADRVKAGDDGTVILYLADGAARARHLGLMHAYTELTGHEGWECGWIDLKGHAAEHCRLPNALLSLVFLGLPEGDPEGEESTSLPQLWYGQLDVAVTLGDQQAIYTRTDLINVITEVVNRVTPETVRTFDVPRMHGDEHQDHAITGAAAIVAVAASTVNPTMLAYRGESTLVEAPNVIGPLFDRSASLLERYEACAGNCGACGETCPAREEHTTLLRRRYAISLSRVASGALRFGNACITIGEQDLLEIGGCSDRWQLTSDGKLLVGDRCVSLVNGELIAGETCGSTSASRFMLDDEGHIWLGSPPPESPGGPLQCMVLVDGSVRARRCGIELAPSWEMSPMPTEMPRPLGLAGTGRAIRLGDLDGDRRADLCEVAANRLQCAPGDGTGNFGEMVTIRSFVVEPESLVIGDVDRDGMFDACGRDAAGILCITAASGFQAQRWSRAFARIGPPDATDHTLAIVASGLNAAEICGVTTLGFACAKHDPLEGAEIRSEWPQGGSTLWPADLDGDLEADWCVGTADGAACGLEIHRLEDAPDGVPWSFSQDGVIDPAPVDASTGALADIDGDGRADLCSLQGRRIACARSQGYGFGPLATLATLPDGAAPTALWLGDLDGDGAADACVDDAGTIRCVRSR